jgi:hypothetical protein
MRFDAVRRSAAHFVVAVSLLLSIPAYAAGLDEAAQVEIARVALKDRMTGNHEPVLAGLFYRTTDRSAAAAICGWAELTGRSAPLRRFVVLLSRSEPSAEAVQDVWIEKADFGFLSQWRTACPSTEIVAQ